MWCAEAHVLKAKANNGDVKTESRRIERTKRKS
jgi:hypothetical protein